MEPITYISINLGPDVGANDSVIGVRVVPDGRNGPEVYGRTLSADEPDTGVGITVETGDKLVFPAGSVKFTLRDVDKHALPGSDGYSPVANTVWTWLQIPPPPTEDFFHYMLAAARRLDAAHALYVSTLRQLTSDPGEPFMRTRVRTFYALSSAEAMCITLNRALTMISIAQAKLSVNTPVPGTVQAVQESVQAIRNAFEHIDERAFGKARQETPVDALTIFNQADLVTSGKLRYANHVLELKLQVLPALADARKFIYDVIAEAGTTKTHNERIEWGPFTVD